MQKMIMCATRTSMSLKLMRVLLRLRKVTEYKESVVGDMTFSFHQICLILASVALDYTRIFSKYQHLKLLIINSKATARFTSTLCLLVSSPGNLCRQFGAR